MPKMSRWQGPNTLSRKKTPEGPLAEMMGGYANDYSRQHSVVPKVMGSCKDGYRHMNSGGSMSGKELTSLPGAHAMPKGVDY